jgi:hypothetical protein
MLPPEQADPLVSCRLFGGFDGVCDVVEDEDIRDVVLLNRRMSTVGHQVHRHPDHGPVGNFSVVYGLHLVGASDYGTEFLHDSSDDVIVLRSRRESVHPVDTSVQVSHKPIQGHGRMNDYLRDCYYERRDDPARRQRYGTPARSPSQPIMSPTSTAVVRIPSRRSKMNRSTLRIRRDAKSPCAAQTSMPVKTS